MLICGLVPHALRCLLFVIYVDVTPATAGVDNALVVGMAHISRSHIEINMRPYDPDLAKNWVDTSNGATVAPL